MSNTTGLIGDPEEGQLALDWGANAAVLFGRQRTEVSHQSTVQHLARFSYLGAIAPAPEPSTIALLLGGLGLFAAGVAKRRRVTV